MREKILGLLQKRHYTDGDIRDLGLEAVPALIGLFDEITDEWTEADIYRRAIAHMLGVLDGDQAVEFLVQRYKLAEGVDKTLQVALVNALAWTDHETALDFVLPFLDGEDIRLRKSVIIGLGESSRPDVLDRLETSALSDTSKAIRRQAQMAAEKVRVRLA